MYADLLRLFGFGLCHQLADRSFFGGGVQVPVCVRDTGIYVGFIVSLALVAVLQKRPTGFPPRWVSVVLAGFVLLMAVDGITSYTGIRETSNAARLVTGLLAGYAMGALAVPLINDQLWRTSSSARVLGTTRSFVLWLASVPVAFVLLWFGGSILGAAYPLAVVLAVLATLTSVNLIIVTMLPVFERRADRLVQAWQPLLIALALAWVEVAASAAVKLLLVDLLT